MAELILVACGAPLARMAGAVADELREAGWEVAVVGTDASRQWLTQEPTEEVPRRPDAVVVCPLSFNTANKWATGISDTRIMGLLNEALGARVLTVAVPMVSDSLWRHPGWGSTLDFLERAGVRWVSPLDGAASATAVAHGSGDAVTDAFQAHWVLDSLA